MPSAAAASRSGLRHEQQHVLGRAHDDGNDDHRERHDAGDAPRNGRMRATMI